MRPGPAPERRSGRTRRGRPREHAVGRLGDQASRGELPEVVTGVSAEAVKTVPSPVQDTEVTVPDPPPEAARVEPEKLRPLPSVTADGAAESVGLPMRLEAARFACFASVTVRGGRDDARGRDERGVAGHREPAECSPTAVVLDLVRRASRVRGSAGRSRQGRAREVRFAPRVISEGAAADPVGLPSRTEPAFVFWIFA